MKKSSIYLKLFLLFVVFFLMAVFIKGESELNFSEIIASQILTISVFTFGLFIMFSLDDRKDRLNSVKHALRAQDSKLFNIYHLFKYFDPETIREFKEKIDAFLIIQLDYRLEDIANSDRELSELFEFVRKIRTETNEQEKVKDKIIDNLSEISSILKEVFYHVKNKMLTYEWLSLLVLFGVILFCSYYGNTNSLVSILIVSTMSFSLALFLLILKQLDTLQWQEQKWIWEPLTKLFQELDLIPYFPEEVVNRVDLKKIEGLREVRIARYKYPYPDFRDKKIEHLKL